MSGAADTRLSAAWAITWRTRLLPASATYSLSVSGACSTAAGEEKVAKVEGRSATQQVVMVLRKFIEERKKEHERG